ncbi:MAG: hypothetical protein KDD67_15140 [Ignavibacteriae bacterium]|nr:hypothetical protein [Ignavibacteriota bacterium]MCB9217566.1 hypothetical protein [Ignavibacteria bacterium]
MDDLIKKVADKVGITTEQAKDAVETVMNFMKDKFPDIGDKVKGLVSGLDKDGDGLDMGDVKSAVTGLFGKKDEEGD